MVRFVAILAVAVLFCTCTVKANEDEAIIFLTQLETPYSQACNAEKVARWNYVTNVTAETEAAAAEAAIQFARYQATIQGDILTQFPDWTTYSSPDVKKQLKFLSYLGPASMDPAHVEEMNNVRKVMEMGYSSARICEYNNPENCNMGVGDANAKLASATNFAELEYYWNAWHDAASSNVYADNYTTFIQYQNEWAMANGFADMSEMSLATFEDGSADWNPKDFKTEILQFWHQIQPTYNVIHAYVRMKLRQNPLYADKIGPTSSIPANLVKNMWSQDWLGLYDSTKPFPAAQSIMELGNEALNRAGYTVDRIFRESDKFYGDLGLIKMTESFWANSMFVAPSDGRVVNCNPPFEWDMCLGKGSEDFRIKLCGQVNMDNMAIIHHEMGHMEYFLQYTNESYAFREGANPGFHEAVGNAMPLAVTTFKHMECALGLGLGLGLDCSLPPLAGHPLLQNDINYMYQIALEKFPFFALTIAMESWRWEVLEGKTTQENYNRRWWEIRTRFQGVSPATPRPFSAFDPAAKSQIPTNTAYFRYFLSYVLQFQIYEGLCIAAGEYDPTNQQSKPLYQCDFSGSVAAGQKLSTLLQSGFRKPWPQLLNEFSGYAGFSITPMLNFFAPLLQFLREELILNGEQPCFDAWCQN
jgi:peptidyl-dipeptidase A